MSLKEIRRVPLLICIHPHQKKHNLRSLNQSSPTRAFTVVRRLSHYEISDRDKLVGHLSSKPAVVLTGWVYNYSIVKITLPDGSSPEGIRCIPDILVENDRNNYLEDKTLIKALEYLNQRYGI